MKKTLAIVGFNPADYHKCKDSKADEFWTMNHAVFVAKDIPRIDRLFEIHKRDWYLRQEMAKRDIYDQWLRNEHSFPIYMQETEITPLVPSGVRYPLEEVCTTLLGNLWKKAGSEEINLQYFTSSYAFMMALAIYEHVTKGYWDDVELYGIGMESNTEYGYQKPCGEFWNGIALGREMRLHQTEECNLHVSAIYGYENVPYVDQSNVRQLIGYYQERLESYLEKTAVAKQQVEADPDNPEYGDNYLIASSWAFLHEGAVNALARLLKESDAYISRQFIEIKRVEYLNGVEYWKTLTNTVKGKMAMAGNGSVSNEDWQAYLDARASMYLNLGATQVHNRLMHVIDFRPVDYELTMDIKETE